MTITVEAKRMTDKEWKETVGKMQLHLPPKLYLPIIGHVAALEKAIQRGKEKVIAPVVVIVDKPKPPANLPVKKGYEL